VATIVTDHPNAILIRELFSAFAAQDADTIRSAIATDCIWHFPGRDSALAGSHTGHEAIFSFLIRVGELTNGTFQLDLEDVIANDNRAVALFRGHGRRSDGRKLDNPTCLAIRLQDSEAVEIHEFVWNLYEVDDFWA
jgi:ketosteroid isomerase-like protein